MVRKISFVIIIILALCIFAGSALADGPPSSASNEAKSAAHLATALVSVVFIAAVVLLALRNKVKVLADPKSAMLPFLIIIAAALVLRVLVALRFPGYDTDLGCFKGWSVAAYEQGPSNFYTSGMFADYPPGYMYILYVLGFIRNIFDIPSSSAVFTLIIKIPSMIAEVLTAIIVYRIGTKQAGKTFGLVASSLILFNPAMFFNTSIWGQIDAVFVLFIVLTLLYLKKENYLLGALFFALSLLIKPQAILFAPVVGLAYFYSLFKKGAALKGVLNILGGTLIFAGVVFVASLPFKGSQSLLWIVDKYAASVETYNYASLNAFNIYSLAGANFKSASDAFIMGMSYQTWGIIFIVLICITIIILQWRSRMQRPLFDLSAFLIISVYMLAHAMHERYIIPVCICLIFSYLYTRDIKTLIFACMFTFTALLGQAFTLYSNSVVAPAIPTLIVSAVNTALYIGYTVVTIRKCITNRFLIKTPALHG